MLIGLVGAPSSGKSTFFKALTLAEVLIANYPFATINPNEGFGHIKLACADKDFDTQCNPRTGYCVDNKRFVPVKLLDVAGLVPGAHKGLGMGNQFLNDLSQAHALIHIVDISGSTNEKGEPVDSGIYDPANNIKFLEKELDLWYLGLIKKGWERFSKQVKQEKTQVKKVVAERLSSMRVTEKIMDGAIKKLDLPENIMNWDDDMLLKLAIELRKVTKPMIIACNKIDVPGGAENFTRIENEFPDHMLIACSSESELALREAAKHELIKYIPGESKFTILNPEKLSDKQKQGLEFIQKNVLDKFGSTGVQQVIDKAVYDLLKYIAIFPGGANKLEDSDGNRLPDCFLMPTASTALDFAFKLHTDLGKNFIRAIDVRTRKTVGKEHQLNHRDVIEIIANK
jgi:ribosome-binding ATPase